MVRSMLGPHEQLQIVGEAVDGSEAVHKARALKPDLVLLDIGLPVLSGIDAAGQISKATPNAKILFVTQNKHADVMSAALSDGARGYVFKTHARRDLVPAIEAVLSGGMFVSG